MGALFALFNTNELQSFELNWKDLDSQLHPQDAALLDECRKMLHTCSEIQSSISTYQGCKEVIKLAMSAPSNTNEQKEATRAALMKVIPNAALAQSWMQFAQKLSKFLVKRLLPRLSAPIIKNKRKDTSLASEEYLNDNVEDLDAINYDDDEKKQNSDTLSVSELTILTHQALVHEFALILNFLLTFDQSKMMQPQIQNDFSFYKRSLSKQKEAHLEDLDWSVSSENAGFVSMFLAQAIPLMKEVATQLANKPQSLKVLAIFCNACMDLLKENKFGKDSESQELSLRAMTAAFVIYDHGNTQFGAFQRKSATKAQKIVSMIANDYESIYGNKDHTEGLANIIKFATLHFNDASTPASIKNAFDK